MKPKFRFLYFIWPVKIPKLIREYEIKLGHPVLDISLRNADPFINGHLTAIRDFHKQPILHFENAEIYSVYSPSAKIQKDFVFCDGKFFQVTN